MVASTLTNLAAVVPFLLITGLAALIFRELILTISFAIVASLATALTLVPMLSAQLAKVERSSHLERNPLVVGFNRGLLRVHRPATGWWPPGRCGCAGWWSPPRWPAWWACVFLTRGLGNEFLPAVDDGNVRRLRADAARHLARGHQRGGRSAGGAGRRRCPTCSTSSPRPAASSTAVPP